MNNQLYIRCRPVNLYNNRSWSRGRSLSGFVIGVVRSGCFSQNMTQDRRVRRLFSRGFSRGMGISIRQSAG